MFKFNNLICHSVLKMYVKFNFLSSWWNLNEDTKRTHLMFYSRQRDRVSILNLVDLTKRWVFDVIGLGKLYRTFWIYLKFHILINGVLRIEEESLTEWRKYWTAVSSILILLMILLRDSMNHYVILFKSPKCLLLISLCLIQVEWQESGFDSRYWLRTFDKSQSSEGNNLSLEDI